MNTTKNTFNKEKKMTKNVMEKEKLPLPTDYQGMVEAFDKFLIKQGGSVSYDVILAKWKEIARQV